MVGRDVLTMLLDDAFELADCGLLGKRSLLWSNWKLVGVMAGIAAAKAGLSMLDESCAGRTLLDPRRPSARGGEGMRATLPA